MSSIRPGPAEPAPPDTQRGDTQGRDRRTFARRIECDDAGERPSRTPPARGGGLRDPEAWEQLRAARG